MNNNQAIHRAVFFLFTTILHELLLGMGLANAQTYTGRVNVINNKPVYIQLNPNVMIMPGEEVTFKASGSVDVNHQHYEVRRCKYFGLKCWYEKRSVPNFREVNEFTIKVDLVASDGTVKSSTEKVTGGNDPFKLSYTADNNSFTSPAKINAYLIYPHQQMNRTPCKGRPRFCSQGEITISTNALAVDIEQRLNRLEEELTDNFANLDPVVVRSDLFIDPLLRDTDSKRKDVQKIFVEKLGLHADKKDYARKVVDIAKYARSLHKNKEQVTILNNYIFEAYVNLGDYKKIVNEGGNNLKTAKDSCENLPGTSKQCIEYSKMLRLNAIGWMEQKARYSSTEIRVALGLLESGVEVLEPGSMDTKQKCNVHKVACELLSAHYIDLARMLTILRTSPELEKAEEYLTSALKVQRFLN
ncbi:MAG: hypothetical protein LC541_08010 [Candidatus Thiodiazotropha sp.]|nr:hypothetical protein [Candidatus Thiodiazotropha sp.]MCM8883225.1 hypothetical protein [Candidatus Thiodiazotropha sp.]MCM8920621.1 hypothetical protein [Candidatus Thiodiazotropha sp.]